MNREQTRSQLKKQARIRRIRRKVFGTAKRPRLALVKTNQHLFAQLIDDAKGMTLAHASTLAMKNGTKTEQAAKAGEMLVQTAKTKKITEAVVDRRGAKYHGRIKAFVEAARQSGLIM
ncbi:50S ribosomal protein L18 [Candidatus Berkelbacteria bacterium]|nr:50S ribosomal protein L18 [Candidatus Berkelbacteria bacterium]